MDSDKLQHFQMDYNRGFTQYRPITYGFVQRDSKYYITGNGFNLVWTELSYKQPYKQ